MIPYHMIMSIVNIITMTNNYLHGVKRRKLKIKTELDELHSKIRLTRHIIAVLLKRKRRRSFQKSCWVQPELDLSEHGCFWEKTVPEYCDVRFKKEFRINKTTFKYICDTLHPYLNKNVTKMREPIPVDKRIAVALYFLKGNADFLTIANLFGIGKSSVGFLVYEFCDALIEAKYAEVIKFPYSEEEKSAIAEGYFEKWQVPDCFGALGRTHIPIFAPKEYAEDYYCYNKSFHSFIILALVDHNYKFTYVNIDKPGSCNDSSVFKNSGLYDLLSRFPTKKHILGDAAFPLLPSLMKPYQITNNMSLKEKKFNYRLSRARMSVENTFGRLKGRWRVLLKKNDLNLDHAKLITKACIVLHNICEDNQDKVPKEWLEDIEIGKESGCDANVPLSAKQKRDEIAETLMLDGHSITLSN